MAAGPTRTNEKDGISGHLAKPQLKEDQVDVISERLAKTQLEEDQPKRDLSDCCRALIDIFKDMEQDPKHENMIKECRERLENITRIYQNKLGNTEERPDFSDPLNQWSYMYRYMLYHSYLVFQSLKMAVDKGKLEIISRGTPLNVCVIGGGPGSDILGLSFLLHKSKCNSQWIRQVDVLDKCIAWENSWSKLYNYLPKEFQDNVKNVRYFELDLTNRELEKENENRIKAAHIVTMTKVVSSVAAWLSPEGTAPTSSTSSGPQTETNSIHSILKNMQGGAILLYIDNDKGQQSEILKKAAEVFEFDEVLQGNLKDLEAPEFYEAIDSDFREKIKWQMCRISKNERFVILSKPGQLPNKFVLQATRKHMTPQL